MTHPAIKHIEWRLSAALRDIEDAFGVSFVADHGVAAALTQIAAACRENAHMLQDTPHGGEHRAS
jgi:plasmid stabilization system protein ParE